MQGLALKQQLLFLIGFIIASVFVSGYIQTFTSASCRCHFHRRQPLRHSLSPIAAFHSLTSASPTVACHSVVYFTFLLPLSASYLFCCSVISLSFVYFRFLSPSLACHSSTSASHSQCRLVVILRVTQESYKSGYRPARYILTNFLLCALQKSCDKPPQKSFR